ncbi:hypothetical protein B0J14DRAFT_635869 [Halenospora varia]|nr:hypothetical protein B0J14DRAFT_635869 [Halenospora varia]
MLFKGHHGVIPGSSTSSQASPSATHTTITLASPNFFDRHFTCPLEEQIHEVICELRILHDPTHKIQHIGYLSITLYDINDEVLASCTRLEAIYDPNHGCNTQHGQDPGPAPSSPIPTHELYRQQVLAAEAYALQIEVPAHELYRRQVLAAQASQTQLAMSNPNAAQLGTGYNTFHGFDNGPPPPSFGPSQGAGSPQYRSGFWSALPTPAFGWPAIPAVPAVPVTPGIGVTPPPPYAVGPFVANGPIMTPQPFPYGGGGSWPSIPPVPSQNADFPCIHLRNHTGGVGLPPGYDYAFPSEHCNIHVFKTKEKPWQHSGPLWAWDQTTHVKLMVPCRATVKELMQNLGCVNEDAKKNVLYEVTEHGNGRWLRGLEIKGDDKDKVKKTIADMGWDKTRTGNVGERPVVWLWVLKE